MVVQRLGVGSVVLGLSAALAVGACSGPDSAPPQGTSAGSAGVPGAGGSAGSGAGAGAGGSSAAGASGSGGTPHVPPMRLADDPTGITGLEACALAANGACVKP